MAGGLRPGSGCREPRGRPRGRVRQAVLRGASTHRCRLWPMLQRPVQRHHGHAPTRDKGLHQLVPPGMGQRSPGGRQSTNENVPWGPRDLGNRAAWSRRPGPICAHRGRGVSTRSQAPRTGTGWLWRDIPGQTALCQAGPAPAWPWKQSRSVCSGLPPGPLGTAPKGRAEPPPRAPVGHSDLTLTHNHTRPRHRLAQVGCAEAPRAHCPTPAPCCRPCPSVQHPGSPGLAPPHHPAQGPSLGLRGAHLPREASWSLGSASRPPQCSSECSARPDAHGTTVGCHDLLGAEPGPAPGPQGAGALCPRWGPGSQSLHRWGMDPARPRPCGRGGSCSAQRAGGGTQMRPGRAPASLASSCRHWPCSWRSAASRQASRALSASVASAAHRPGPPGTLASVLTSRRGPWGRARPSSCSQARCRAARSCATAVCRARLAALHSGPWPPTCTGDGSK